MKIMYISFKNIELFTEGLDIDLTASDRVVNINQVTNLYKSIYSQNVLAFVGANATGKTTVLKLLKAVINIVVNNKGLDQIDISPGILKDNSKMIVIFYNKGNFYKLESTIVIKKKLADCEYIFADEVIYVKSEKKVTSRKSIFDFDEVSLTRKDFIKSEFNLLKPQDSIAAAFTENDLYCRDTLLTTNFNIYVERGNEIMPFINLFDNSIEKLESSNDEVKIKFKNTEEIYKSSNLFEAEKYLSSGTIKGSGLITAALLVMRKGGYLIIDEIENHLHKKLVQIIIGLFNDNEINKNGATLIFSTHYSEIIDCIDRKDNIYVLIRDDTHVSKAVRYSDKIFRNDIKKSEIFLSNYINGTAPSYESIRSVKELICELMK